MNTDQINITNATRNKLKSNIEMLKNLKKCKIYLYTKNNINLSML